MRNIAGWWTCPHSQVAYKEHQDSFGNVIGYTRTSLVYRELKKEFLYADDLPLHIKGYFGISLEN